MTDETATLDLEPIAQMKQSVDAVVSFAHGFEIVGAEEASEASEILARIAAYRKQIKDARMSITRPLDAAKKAAIDQEKAVLGPLEEVDRDLRKRIGAYHAEIERKRREEAERQEALAKAAEAKAKAEAEEREREAQEAEARNDTEAADEAREQAELAEAQVAMIQRSEAPTVAPTGPIRSAAGTATVPMVWQATITDADAVPREYCEPKQGLVDKAMRAGIDGDTCSTEIPGVTIERVPQVRVRAKR